jgi:two-component system OmpR family sensor kinase
MSVWARAPLRVKLVVAVVVLAAAGLGTSGVAAHQALHGYLVNRVDQQLHDFADRRPSRFGSPNPCDGLGGGPDALSTAYRICIPAGSSVAVTSVPVGKHGPQLPDQLPTSPTTLGANGDDAPWRALGVVDQNGTTFLYALSLSDVQNTNQRLALLELVIGGVVLVLLGGAGSFVVRRSLRPLVEVEAAAEAIAEGDLSQRVPESDPRTEVGSLSQSFNTMVARLESAFSEQAASEAEARASEQRMRRFIGDASHELRTPLTSIRGFAELYRQGALPAPADVDRAMSRVESEASRMGLLVEDLLLLARLDQQRPLERAPVDLLELAGDAVADAQAVDPSRSVSLEAVADGPAPVVSGDAARLRQVFGNLVANALTHTPTGSPVVVRVSTTSAAAVVDVRDSGPGIPPENRAKVFERFFRADTSRTRASGGTGLGLSIVAALVAAHGGTVEVHETEGGGATFRVIVPLA